MKILPEQKKAVIIKISDGQGNQMFQYAAAYALAKKHNVPLYCETSRYAGQIWHLKNEICNMVPDYKEVPMSFLHWLALFPFIPKIFKRFLRRLDWYIDIKTKHTFIEKGYCHYDESFLKTKSPVMVSGFFLSPKYFADYEDEIIDIFSNQKIGKPAQKIAHEIKQTKDSIALHFRDYKCTLTSHQGWVDMIGELSLEYYEKAIETIIEKNSIPPDKIKIFVFSNGLENAKEFLKRSQYFKHMHFVQYQIQYNWEDMLLMSFCSHNIIANSSYSWWSAFLNKNPNKTVVTHKTWVKYLLNRPNHNLFPDNWIKIK